MIHNNNKKKKMYSAHSRAHVIVARTSIFFVRSTLQQILYRQETRDVDIWSTFCYTAVRDKPWAIQERMLKRTAMVFRHIR